MTLLRGEVVAENGEIVAANPRGRLVGRRPRGKGEL